MNQPQENNLPSTNQTNNQQAPIYQPQKQNKSSKPIIAGSLLIMVGLIGLIFSGVVIGGGLVMDTLEDIPFQGFSVTSMEGSIIDESGNAVSSGQWDK